MASVLGMADGYTALSHADAGPRPDDSTLEALGRSRRPGPGAAEDEMEPGERFAFVEGDRFQSFIGLVIALNIVVLWGETDAPELPFWTTMDNMFLGVFIVEMALRISHLKLRGYFGGKDRWWAYLDAVIVGLGVLDLWIAPLVMQEVGAITRHSTLLRTLRLLRLIRLLRVFKMFDQLMSFANALSKMMTTVLHIFLVLFIFIFIWGVLLVHVLGRPDNEDMPELQEEVRVVRSFFGNVGTSLFTLFQLTTADNWDTIADPVIAVNGPWWRLFFVIFIVFAAWINMALLSAEASDRMIEASTDRKQFEERQIEIRHKEFINFLRDAFLEADADGNGLLDMEEFQALMDKDFVLKRMKELGIHLSQDELMKTWAMLDVDDSGELTIEEFVDGLGFLQESLGTKHIVNVDYSLKRVERKVLVHMDKINHAMSDVMHQNEVIQEKLQHQDQVHRGHQLSLQLWHQWAEKNKNNLDGLADALPSMSHMPSLDPDLLRQVRNPRGVNSADGVCCSRRRPHNSRAVAAAALDMHIR